MNFNFSFNFHCLVPLKAIFIYWIFLTFMIVFHTFHKKKYSTDFHHIIIFTAAISFIICLITIKKFNRIHCRIHYAFLNHYQNQIIIFLSLLNIKLMIFFCPSLFHWTFSALLNQIKNQFSLEVYFIHLLIILLIIRQQQIIIVNSFLKLFSNSYDFYTLLPQLSLIIISLFSFFHHIQLILPFC